VSDQTAGLAETEALWTVSDVARFLSCSSSFVYKAAESGRLPCLRIGAMVRFDPSIVRAMARGELPHSQGKLTALREQG
jgi:excisionase family DNA binding protein